MIVTKNLFDVSNSQGLIDWQKVATAKKDGVIIRAGYRGYGTPGTLATDKQFTANMRGAIAAGLSVGCYWVSQALSDNEAVAEAKYLLTLLGPYKASIKFPVFLDSEYGEAKNATGRADHLPKQLRTQYGLKFLETVKAGGYTTGLYCSENWFTEFINGEAFREAGHKIWIANVSKKPSVSCDAWQYSWKGTIPGISTAVDLDYFYCDEADDQISKLEAENTRLTEENNVLKTKLAAIREILG